MSRGIASDDRAAKNASGMNQVSGRWETPRGSPRGLPRGGGRFPRGLRRNAQEALTSNSRRRLHFSPRNNSALNTLEVKFSTPDISSLKLSGAAVK